MHVLIRSFLTHTHTQASHELAAAVFVQPPDGIVTCGFRCNPPTVYDTVRAMFPHLNDGCFIRLLDSDREPDDVPANTATTATCLTDSQTEPEPDCVPAATTATCLLDSDRAADCVPTNTATCLPDSRREPGCVPTAAATFLLDSDRGPECAPATTAIISVDSDSDCDSQPEPVLMVSEVTEPVMQPMDHWPMRVRNMRDLLNTYASGIGFNPLRDASEGDVGEPSEPRTPTSETPAGDRAAGPTGEVASWSDAAEDEDAESSGSTAISHDSSISVLPSGSLRLECGHCSVYGHCHQCGRPLRRAVARAAAPAPSQR